MATNLKLDEGLLEAATAIGKCSSKKQAVTEALKEYIARRQQQEIKDLFGCVVYEPNYSYKKERRKKR
jgi:Arc/MetJ family transcription regulator